MRHWRTTLAVIATVALVGTACTPGPQTGGTAQPEEKPVAGGRVIRGSFSDIRVLNPVIATDATSGQVTDLLFDPLLRPDPKTGNPIPWMGKWTASADNLTFSWEIDSKANWSDGKPVIAGAS